MKNVYIVLLVLSSISAFSQSKKGAFVISPQLIVSEWAFQSNDLITRQRVVVSSSFHYYLSSRISLGAFLVGSYSYRDPHEIYSFKSRTYSFILSPEIQYTVLTTRLTPFFRLRVGEFGYLHQFIDNPAYPERQRRSGNFLINYPLYGMGTSLGISYSVKERFALNALLNCNSLNYGIFSDVSAGVGCQFTLN